MNELKSYTEYAVSTPTADFVIGFDFNYGEDAVNVTVDDVPATTAGYTVVYLNETTIRLSPSVPSGVVRLQRETDIDQTDHAYRAGAKFIAQTMDENFEQLRHSQQEVRDGFVKLADDTYEIIDGLDAALELAQDAASDAQEAAVIAQGAADTVNTIIVEGKVGADNVLDASGETQQQVNYNGGSKWHSRVGGYLKNERAVLANGDIVKSTIDGNTNDPNAELNDGGIIVNGWTRIDYNGVADPCWFGADKDGAADVTPILNAMITAGYKNIHFATAGDYLISTQLTAISDGVTINFGKSNDAKIKFGANIVWCQPKTKNNIKFYNIDIQDILKTSNDAFRPLLINPLGCSEIDVYDIKTEDCAIVLTGSFNGTGEASYSEANADITSPSFNCCKNVRVHHIYGKDTLINTRCIVNLSYAINWVVHNISVPNAKFPAVFWGGDSNPTTGNGAASNERKNKKGIMSKIISDDNDALAWGSMGDEILITGCIGENFGDVGVDFEGCTNCVATNNFVKNANNGNYTNFFLNKNVKFVDNISILSGSKVDHYKNYNITQSNAGLEGVQFTGNTLTSLDVVGKISDLSGTVGDIIIKDNIAKNVIIDISAGNANGASIKGNKLNYTMTLDQSPIRVATQFTRSIVKDNEFSTSINQSVAPITVSHTDFNNSGVYQIEGNTVIWGTFSKALKLLDDSANAGVGLVLYAFNNKLTSNQIESSNPSRIFIKQWSENKNGESNFPNSADNSQYMWKNMIARPDDYAVGQPLGWVCTASGNPATWVALSNL